MIYLNMQHATSQGPPYCRANRACPFINFIIFLGLFSLLIHHFVTYFIGFIAFKCILHFLPLVVVNLNIDL